MSDDEVRFHWENGSFDIAAAGSNLTDAGQDEPRGPGSETIDAAPAKPIGLRLIVALLLISLAAVGIASGVRADQGRTIATTRTIIPPAAGTTGVDAIGCPNAVNCSIAGFFVPEPAAAAQRAFPDSTQLGSRAAVGEVDNSHYYFKTVTVRTKDGVVITAASQCVPHGVPIPDHTDLSPRRNPTDLVIVLGGADGCSVAVTAHAAAGVPLPVSQLRNLAHDPMIAAS
ncbi:MAG TPA: hypothetical protein VGH11_07710 [Jatrophihabitans sp.]|jgi:hypothetical protein